MSALNRTVDDRTPDYYRGAGGVQPFDVIDAFGLDFYEGNAVKYLLRWKQKGGVKDLRKARHYIDEILVRATEDLVDEDLVAAEDMERPIEQPQTAIIDHRCAATWDDRDRCILPLGHEGPHARGPLVGRQLWEIR